MESTSKKFSLDGRLVGNIGEVLTAEKYGLELFSENCFQYDAKKDTITESGDLEELYNGPGYFIMVRYIKKHNLKHY